MSDYEVYEIPGFTTQGGITLDVKLAYRTYGTLSPAADNVVLIPTFYSGRHEQTEYMIAPGRAVDVGRHFVIIVNMLGNGYSTSRVTRSPLTAAAGSR